MQTAAELRAHYDAVRARLFRPLAGLPAEPISLKANRPPIIYPARLRRYRQPIGPVKPIRRGLSMRAIIDATALVTGVTSEEIVSSKRSKQICQPRWIAMYIARQGTGLSLPHIGRHIGGKDHTTVLHGVRRIEYAIKGNADLAAKIATATEIARSRQ